MDLPTNLPNDPRALTLTERRALCLQFQSDNRRWLERLEQLAEPRPERDFPAFLLATPACRDLAQRIGTANQRHELTTATADELDRFVEAYRHYLRTCAGEDVFTGQSRRAS